MFFISTLLHIPCGVYSECDGDVFVV